MILDDAHNVKDFQSPRWKIFFKLRAERRMLLTTSALPTSAVELWSHLHFLLPDIFTTNSEYSDASSSANAGEGASAASDTVVQRLQSALRPFLLRRQKKDVESQLPNKHERVVSCPLTKRQRSLYDDYMATGTTQAKLDSGTLFDKVKVLMQLRKVRLRTFSCLLLCGKIGKLCNRCDLSSSNSKERIILLCDAVAVVQVSDSLAC